jgi:prophage DNA circulation protein
MDWKKRLREASFRGVQFFVPAHDGSGGRRGIVHEFPGKDVPYLEDMGRAARSFSIEAYILGDDYFVQRNRLLNVIEAKGTGKLIHPYFGEFVVQCLTYSIRETVQEGRIARFTLNFAEAGALSFPKILIAPQEAISRQKLFTFAMIKKAFKKAYSIARVPYSVSQRAIETINKGFELVEDTKKIVGVVASFEQDLLSIKGDLIRLAYDALELCENVIDIVNFGTELGLSNFDLTPDNSRDQFAEFRKLIDFEPDTTTGVDDPSSIFSNMFQQVSITSVASLMSEINFKSLNEAEEMSSLVYDKMQELSEQIIDDDLFAAFQDLRSLIHRDLDTRIISLPRLVLFTPYETTNSLALTYYLYGSIEKETEIINRNKIRHPGFVMGSRPLEVLLNVE